MILLINQVVKEFHHIQSFYSQHGVMKRLLLIGKKLRKNKHGTSPRQVWFPWRSRFFSSGFISQLLIN